MTTEQLYDQLNYVDSTKASRLEFAQQILNQPELTPVLLELIFKVEDALSPKAAWILEVACGENLNILLPYLDHFTLKMPTVHFDSAVRSMAKICEYLTKAFYINSDPEVKTHLKSEHKERIIELCFDYMINDNKTAPKAYSMQTLFLLGKEYSWIHPELATILQRDFQQESAGFKARARHILKAITTS